MIRFVKERLSIAMRANGDGRWVVHVPSLVRDYNNQIVKGSGNVKRKDVNKNNYLDMLEKVYKSTSPSLLFNMGSVPEQSSLSKFIWKYQVGDSVMLARRVSEDVKGRGDAYFEKPSVKGTFGPKVYKIAGRHTKMNSGLFLCAVYSLRGVPGKYYQTDLSPALFAGPDRSSGSRRRRRRQQQPKRT
jgi:hypothetical protein